MTTFEERERAFEAKYAHDEEFRFRVMARRDKLFAHWAADRLAIGPEAEKSLTDRMLHVVDGVGHDERVLESMSLVFQEHHAVCPAVEMTASLQRCAVEARKQLLDQAGAI